MSFWGHDKAIEPLEARLAKQEMLNDDLAREVRGLKLEYIELYDKVRHQMSRMAKRTAVQDREHNADEVLEPAVGVVDAISAKIHARRGFLRNQV